MSIATEKKIRYVECLEAGRGYEVMGGVLSTLDMVKSAKIQ